MPPTNKPPLAEDPDAKTNPFMFRLDVLQSDHVRYANQPIAVVIAETLEAATQGAALLSPRYHTEPARTGLDSAESFVPPAVGIGNPAFLSGQNIFNMRCLLRSPPEGSRSASSLADRRYPRPPPHVASGLPDAPPGSARAPARSRTPKKCGPLSNRKLVQAG